MQRNSELQPKQFNQHFLITNYFAKFIELGYVINNTSKVAKTENIFMNFKKRERQKCLYQGLKVVTNEKGEAVGEVLTIIC